MRSILLFLFIFSLFLTGCEDDYSYTDEFTEPQTLISPEPVTLDLAAGRNVVFSWKGGGAADGGIVLYEVLFDRPDGDFSDPVYQTASDLGGMPQLTLNHVTLNKIARLSGVKTGETGIVKWTVRASRGGIVKQAKAVGEVSLTRPEGLEVPERLYLFGSASENGTEGQAFRLASEGVFVIYTTLPADGEIYFAGDLSEEAVKYYVDADGLLVEGTAATTVNKQEVPVRLTVNFNTKRLSMETVSAIRMIWGCNYNTIADLSYTAEGVFKAENVALAFVQPDRPDTNPPDWLTWTEERYYFIATVNGAEVCWGRMDNVSSERPGGDEPLSFYELGEFAWSQWDHLWKMSGDLDLKKCTVTIHTNLEGLMVHQFSDVTAL